MYLCFARRLRSEKVWSTLPKYIGTGLSDLQAVDSLEPVRAITVKSALSKRKIWNESDFVTPVKRPRVGSVTSEASTADTSSTKSESENSEPFQTSSPEI
jgi:hypothetical protein